MTDTERNQIKAIAEQLEQGLKELSQLQNGVAEWGNTEELEGLKNSLDTIRKSSSELLTRIEETMPVEQEEQDYSAMLDREREANEQVYFEERNMEPVDQLLLGEQDQYGIFQLKHNNETRDIRFMSHDFLQQNGIAINRENYDLVYTAPLTADVTLEGLYEKFNIDRPEDFTGHSLSVSDVVVLHQKGKNSSHYVDSFGFTEVPEFHRYPTIEEQIAQEETVDLLKDNHSGKISYYVIEDLATWADNSKERSALERFDNIEDAIKQFQTYRGQDWEYSDDSARTTLGISMDGIEFDMIHIRNDENYLVQDFTQMSVTKDNDQFLDVLQMLQDEIGFDKTRLHREMTPDEVKNFVKERFAHQLESGGVEDISLYMERFDALYEQGKMEQLMPTVNQRQVQEDVSFSEWENPYMKINQEVQEREPEELAVAIEDRYISIQTATEGYDYTIYDADYRELDGGVYDNQDISIKEALEEIISDLKEATMQTETENSQSFHLQGKVHEDSKVTFIDYEELTEKTEQVEQKKIADAISKRVEDNRIVDEFKAKTRECFHNIHGETPDDIENTVYAYVRSKIEEYDARASIVDIAVAGSRCRGIEQESSDLDVVVEFAGNEREDDLFNLLHEDGLMIGGISVDINPITKEKSGTLATYLPQVEQYLAEKQAEQTVQEEVTMTDTPQIKSDEDRKKVIVTLTVAECSEFHNLGEYHEGIETVEDAVTAWEQIPPERMRGLPGIGIHIHTEGRPEYEDIQWDILSGKVIDLSNLSYVPDITDNLQAIRFISELVEKVPDVKVYGSLEPWIQSHAEKIAAEVDQLSYDYDPYEYKDQVEDRETHLQSLASDIKNGQAEYMEDFLNAMIAEETRTGIQDLFGADMDTNDSEAIQMARKAKELLDRLTEYKPLAKVEELEEQNYNMIDNVLNNGGGEKQSERVSVKERLSQKKAEIEQCNKSESIIAEREFEKKMENEL